MAQAQNKDEEKSKPIFKELSGTSTSIPGLSGAFYDFIRKVYDTKLFECDGEEYRRMLRDDQVHATFQQRRLAVVSCPYSVAPGGDTPRDAEAAEHLSMVLSKIGWSRITDKMLYGVFHGYAVAEVMWAIEDNRVEIDSIKVRDRLRFRFDKDNKLRLRTDTNHEGIEMEDKKFWTFRSGGDHDDMPYGLGLGYQLYWPVWFKREGLRSWLRGLDKTARPTVLGKYSGGASPDDVEKLLETLEAVASDVGVAIPESMSIELMQAARTGTADYGTLYHRMDAAISKIVLSQTMTTDSSAAGLGSNQADVHQDVKGEVVEADARVLSESFNCSVAQWLTEWNFPGAARPLVQHQTEDEEDIEAAIDRDTKLYAMGWEPTEEKIQTTYGEGYERRKGFDQGSAKNNDTGNEGDGGKSGAEFAAPQARRAAIETDLAGALDKDWQKVIEPLVAPIRQLLADVSTYEDAERAILDVFPEMDEAPLRQLLAQAGFSARLAATLDAIDDDDDASLDFSDPDEFAAWETSKKKAPGCGALAEFEELSLSPLPPAEAIRFFERKGYAISFDWRDVWQQEHARSFTVAKVTRLDLLETIRAEVQKGLADGIPFETFRKNLTPKLQEAGWWGRKAILDPFTGETVEAQLGSPRRLKTIFNTNLKTARAAGRWERIQRIKGRRPYLRYSQIQRITKRDEHVPFHGLVRPVDDPIWSKIYPPNGFGCGCSVQQLTRAQAEKIGISPESRSKNILRRPQTYTNPRTGEVMKVTRGVHPGFDYNVGEAHMRGAEQALVTVLSKSDVATARVTLSEVVAGEAFSDFLANPERHNFHPVMILEPSHAQRIGAKTPIIRLSADTLEKQRLRHPEITEADYRALPGLAAAPDLIVQQGEQTLIYVREGENWLYAVVKATKTGEAAFVTSVRRTNQADVDRATRKGRVIYRRRD